MTLSVRNPKPETMFPKPSVPSPASQTPNPRPLTPNPRDYPSDPEDPESMAWMTPEEKEGVALHMREVDAEVRH